MRVVAWGLWGALAVTPVQAAEVEDWLARMVDAERRVSFHGTFVYERNGSFSSHRLWHQVADDGAVRQRLVQLDGPLQEVVSVNGQVQCVSGAIAEQLGQGYSWPVRSLDPTRLDHGYQIHLAGYSRIAGRLAAVLLFTPVDQHRYGLELHLDQQSGLPLKSLLISDKGHLLERLQYTDLALGESQLADVQASINCRALRIEPRVSVAVEDWQVQWLPAGFTQVLTRTHQSSVSGAPVETLVFDDGVASFSVFLEPLGQAQAADFRQQFGPTAVASRRINTAQGVMMATVVGEIPLGTAERIALSVRFLPAAQ